MLAGNDGREENFTKPPGIERMDPTLIIDRTGSPDRSAAGGYEDEDRVGKDGGMLFSDIPPNKIPWKQESANCLTIGIYRRATRRRVGSNGLPFREGRWSWRSMAIAGFEMDAPLSSLAEVHTLADGSRRRAHRPNDWCPQQRRCLFHRSRVRMESNGNPKREMNYAGVFRRRSRYRHPADKGLTRRTDRFSPTSASYVAQSDQRQQSSGCST